MPITEIDWKTLSEITSIGPIAPHGDSYYDGIIEAHNPEFFITRCDEVYELDAEGQEISNSYEIIYLVYRMDYIFKHCLEYPKFERMPEECYFPRSDGYERADLSGSQHSSFHLNLLLAAREHAKNLRPLGYIREGNLDRSGGRKEESSVQMKDDFFKE